MIDEEISLALRLGYKMQCSDSLLTWRPRLELADQKCAEKSWNWGFGVNDPLSENFRNSVPREFMTAPIHVLSSNSEEIGRREVSETMRCFW